MIQVRNFRRNLVLTNSEKCNRRLSETCAIFSITINTDATMMQSRISA